MRTPVLLLSAALMAALGKRLHVALFGLSF